HRLIEGLHRNAGDQDHRTQHHHNEQEQGGVHGEDELAESEQHVDALGAHGDANGRTDAERGEVHDVAGIAEHHFGERGAETHHRVGLGADGGAGGAEQEGEDHHLEHVVAGHGIDDAGGEGVLEDGRQGGGRLRHGGLRGGGLNGDAFAGADQVDYAEAQEERDRGDHFEVEDRLQSDAAHLLHVAAAGDAGHQRAEQEGGDDGADEAQKDVADGAELLGEVRRYHSQ